MNGFYDKKKSPKSDAKKKLGKEESGGGVRQRGPNIITFLKKRDTELAATDRGNDFLDVSRNKQRWRWRGEKEVWLQMRKVTDEEKKLSSTRAEERERGEEKKKLKNY